MFAAILGTGVGAGIVVDGRLLTGPNGLAGEWGHNPLPWADADERPGPRPATAAAAVASKPGSAARRSRTTIAPTGQTLSARRSASGPVAGDAACELTLQRYEDRAWLVRSRSVINLLDPDVIVLGGGLSLLARLYDNVPRLWSAHVFSAGSAAPPRTALRASLHGDSSGVRGAAWLWPAR